MSRWEATIFLDAASAEPLFRQISRALADEIGRGRFRPGDHLPGYRTVAEQLGVSRNTVMAAYRELQAEGWVVTQPVVGSVVAPRPPVSRAPHTSPAPAPARGPGQAGFDIVGRTGARSEKPVGGLLQAGTGLPDPRLLPGAALARAYRRAVTARGGAALAAVDPRGHRALREALARMVASSRGIAVGPEEVFVTRGSQMGLFLVAQAVCPSGGGVAVEAMGNRRAWETLARAGARCHPVQVDGGGLDVDDLERLADREPLRAVLVTPQRQYPTLVPLAPERRARLLALAAARRLAVLELDPDCELQFEGPPLRPLASEDRAGVVVHLGSLSRLFAPAVRLGFVVAPSPLVSRLKGLRAAVDRHGDPALEIAVAELMDDGELQRHLNRVRLAYRSRRDALCEALQEELAGTLRVEPPTGGLAIWAKVQDGTDVEAWAVRALEGGVAFQPGRAFAFDRAPVAALRLGFAGHAAPELREIARRLRVAASSKE